MGHIPEDENFDDFMNASAEEWSKEEESLPVPEPVEEPTDRWGSPSPVEDPKRWGSEPLEKPQTPTYDTPEKNKGSKWWIIAIIVVVLLCIFACVAIVLIFGSVFSIFQSDFSGLIQIPFVL